MAPMSPISQSVPSFFKLLFSNSFGFLAIPAVRISFSYFEVFNVKKN